MRQLVLTAIACVASICILSMSKNIATLNQNDFFLAFDSLLDNKPLDVVPYNGFAAPAFVWAYSNSNSKPLHDRNLSWIYLWAHTRLQRLFSTHFDLFLMALISKTIVLACCYRLSITCVRKVLLPTAFQVPFFLLFALAFAYAHNIAFLNSFYGEHTFLVFLPVTLVGIFEQRRWIRVLLISVGLLFASGAKPQYFYLAALVAGVMALFGLMERRRFDVPLLGLLLAVFGVSWFFAFNASGNAANYYNSTYFGSYLLLPKEELAQLGVKAADLECVGDDPWGNRIEGRDTLKFSHGRENCALSIPITLKDVAAPYIRNPALLLDLWRFLAPAHFTVLYFHVYPATKYLLPSDGRSFHSGRTLIRASELRQRFITPWYAVIIVLGMLLPFISYKRLIPGEVKIATLTLALFIPSQFAVSLLGEGARDLSKHLMAAQFCLDLLCVFLILQLAAHAFSLYGKGAELVRTLGG